MGFSWHFNRVRAGDQIREPIEGEFFATDAISRSGEALIRETIQNSLDAARPGQPVSLRIYLSGQTNALKSKDVAPFTEALWPHLQAERNGLRDAPSLRDSCPFLVLEDFGTTGLTGDSSQWQPVANTCNHFFNFARAEGRSDKRDQDRGRWGVGKQAIARASRASSYFFLTVRSDDHRRLLMGQSSLRSHHCDGIFHAPDGWYGIVPSANEGLVKPIQDATWLRLFEQLFMLKRGEEPGLSIIIPWYLAELTQDQLANAVLRAFFWPILQGQLKVFIENQTRMVVLDARAVSCQTRSLPLDIEPDLAAAIELACWAIQAKPSDYYRIKMPASNRPWEWSASLIPDDLMPLMHADFTGGKALAIRVPVTVRAKYQPASPTHFDIFMLKDAAEKSGRPIFIRQGMVVPAVRAPRTPGVRSLVVAHDTPMASLLGDAENPGHTEWLKDSSNFRGKYPSGPIDLAFVTQSVHAVTRMLSEGETCFDNNLLSKFFSLPSGPRPGTSRSGDGRETGVLNLVSGPLDSRHFSFERTANGFVIGAGELPIEGPVKLNLEAAYRVRQGSPFRRWRPDDFELDRPPVRIQASGLELTEITGNRLTATICEKTFRLQVSGFDRRRDLQLRMSADVPAASLEEEEANAAADN